MDAQALMLPLLLEFVNCFTSPGFDHFQNFIIAHASLLGLPHCVTEVMRLTGLHRRKHWTTPYKFLTTARWSCTGVGQRLLELIVRRLGLGEELIVALDDTIAPKTGRGFFGLGYYRDPTDKNPGAHKRAVLAHCWVVAALLVENTGRWFAFPLAALLFVPRAACPKGFPLLTKIELAHRIISRLQWPARRIVIVADNLYAKAKLAGFQFDDIKTVLVSRLRSNAALYQLPPPNPGRGRPRKRGKKLGAKKLWQRKWRRRKITARVYGQNVTYTVVAEVVIPSHTLTEKPVIVVVFPQRSKKKMNVFFSTDINLDPARLLEIYAARFQIEELFREVKTSGGFSDCRQRKLTPLKRHATLTLVAYAILRLISVTLPASFSVQTDPWYNPQGPPSVTRLRRAWIKALGFSIALPPNLKTSKITPLKRAA